MPREDVHLPDLYKIARNLILIGVERIEERCKFRIRYFGTGLSEEIGENPMGKYLDQFSKHSDVQRIIDHYQKVVDTRAENILIKEINVFRDEHGFKRRGKLSIKEIGLPLLGPTGTIDFIIGVVFLERTFFDF
ncbi:MAG: hypothetical protein ACPGO3_10855 [Magnetospiraceae bacterium]